MVASSLENRNGPSLRSRTSPGRLCDVLVCIRIDVGRSVGPSVRGERLVRVRVNSVVVFGCALSSTLSTKIVSPQLIIALLTLILKYS